MKWLIFGNSGIASVYAGDCSPDNAFNASTVWREFFPASTGRICFFIDLFPHILYLLPWQEQKFNGSRLDMARSIKQAEDNIVNSIIGEGSEFKGEFKINGLLRIDGKFKGTIETDGKVLIGKTGESVTDIKARVVVIGGTVRGNIFASERVILLSTGRVKGNIITPSIVMEEGIEFEGNCLINKTSEEISEPVLEPAQVE